MIEYKSDHKIKILIIRHTRKNDCYFIVNILLLSNQGVSNLG